MNGFLCEKKLEARLRMEFSHLDSQLKNFIKVKSCPITPRDIIQLFNVHALSIYNGIILPSYIKCAQEFNNFQVYSNIRMDIDQDFWAKCWTTFVHRFSLEPHILINTTCQGNHLVNIWVQSVMDNLWLHIHFPLDDDDEEEEEDVDRRSRRPVAASEHRYDPYSRRYHEGSQGGYYYRQRDEDEVESSSGHYPQVEPLRIQMKSTEPLKHYKPLQKKTRPSTPSESSFDSNVS